MPKTESYIKPIPKPLLLIVDQNVTHLRHLGSILRRKNFEVAVAQDGRSAIEITRRIKPDIVLLDLMMIDIDGYEVCETLVNDPITQDIPIIFLSSVLNTENIIQGLQLGAVDFIRKSDNEDELIARINTHLKMKRYREQLEKSNKQLISLNVELNKLNEEKDEFLGIAAHDLKNPINNILLISKILYNDNKLPEDDIKGFAKDISSSCERMLELINNLLDINKIEQGEISLNKTQIDLRSVVKYVVESYNEKARIKNINIKLELPKSKSIITSDNSVIIQILDNIVSNAVKYSPLGKSINIKLIDSKSQSTIYVQDEGPGFTDEDKQKLFNKFARLSAEPTGGENSTGLGLSIVKKLSEVINANISLESKAGEGATFILEINKNR